MKESTGWSSRPRIPVTATGMASDTFPRPLLPSQGLALGLRVARQLIPDLVRNGSLADEAATFGDELALLTDKSPLFRVRNVEIGLPGNHFGASLAEAN